MNSQKSILLIDDEPAFLKTLGVKLEWEGYKVITATDGKEGLELASSLHPDLIILDILMPVMDGIQVLEKLRQNDWGKDVPVMMLTNLTHEEKESKAYAKNVKDYIVKSNWTLADILTKVNKYIG